MALNSLLLCKVELEPPVSVHLAHNRKIIQVAGRLTQWNARPIQAEELYFGDHLRVKDLLPDLAHGSFFPVCDNYWIVHVQLKVLLCRVGGVQEGVDLRWGSVGVGQLGWQVAFGAETSCCADVVVAAGDERKILLEDHHL